MADPIIAAESPLAPVYRTGSFGNFADGTGVTLSEILPGSIVQIAAWPDTLDTVLAAIRNQAGLNLSATPGAGAQSGMTRGFGIGPNRFLVISQAEDVAADLKQAIPAASGSVTDLSHGRTVIRVAGPKAEWVLSKLFAIDFALAAFPVDAARATVHHDIQAQIQRTAPEQFDLVVFRSFARAFWKVLGHSAEDVGYVVR